MTTGRGGARSRSGRTGKCAEGRSVRRGKRREERRKGGAGLGRGGRGEKGGAGVEKDEGLGGEKGEEGERRAGSERDYLTSHLRSGHEHLAVHHGQRQGAQTGGKVAAEILASSFFRKSLEILEPSRIVGDFVSDIPFPRGLFELKNLSSMNVSLWHIMSSVPGYQRLWWTG